jgi:predicted transcriptional regulator
MATHTGAEMATTRKNIDFPDELVEHMDRIKEERHVTYNDIIVPALQQYLSPGRTALPDELRDRLDGIGSALQQTQQRLWSLDSVSQKTAERLAVIDTHLDGLQGVIQQAMELIILIGERLAEAPVGELTSTQAPARLPTPSTPEEDPVTDILHDPRSQWYIPPPKDEKRGWFGRGRS